MTTKNITIAAIAIFVLNSVLLALATVVDVYQGKWPWAFFFASSMLFNVIGLTRSYKHLKRVS